MPRHRKIGEYCGREYLYGLIKVCDETPYKRNQERLRKRDRALIATLFLTGGFVEEVRRLRKVNFDFNDTEAQARNAFVVKKMRLFGYGKPKHIFRTFPIFKDDPLVDNLLHWLDEVDDYLFVGQSKRRPLSRQTAWGIIKKLRKHLKYRFKQTWFREQRKLYFVRELGWSDFHIQQYFKMQRLPTISGDMESWRNLLYIHRKPRARESMERLIFPNAVLERLPPEVIKTVKGVMLNYHNGYPRFCFGGMRTALSDAIRIRFMRDKKQSELYDQNKRPFKLLKWIDLAKREGYISSHHATFLKNQAKVFGDISLHDFMADLRKEEVPSIFTHLRMALARMYYEEKRKE